MNDHSKQFLFDLLLSGSPSGFEEPAARIWRQEAESFADEVTVDTNGNSVARLRGDGPKVVIEGHIDEIGLLISHIDDEGYVWFTPVGGWDDQILTGQRLRIMAANGPVPGVIGRRPAHLLSAEDRGKASRIKDLWIDIGATSGEQARERVSIGDPIVIEQPIVDLGNNRIAARGVDNRMGAWIALETLRELSSNRPAADVYAVAAVQEEITFLGGMTSAFSLNPDVAVVLDVTHATDHPEADKRGQGDVRVGGGPVLTRGATVNPRVFQHFAELARANEIPFAIEAAGRSTGTDSDGIAPARGGIPTGIVSIANRYMHSPNEVISLDDLDAAVRLIALFVADLGNSADFTRR